MASTVNGYNNYNIAKKFYTNSIQSDSTEMTEEEDEDFRTFTNSSSFQTSTTNSSPINAKLALEELLLSLGFYSGPSWTNTQLNSRSHSNHVRRSMIQSPSMRNFNQDLYATDNNNNKSITTIHEMSPPEQETVTMEIPTKLFGMTSSPSMRALENILNQKTRSQLSGSLVENTIYEGTTTTTSDEDFALQPPVITHIHNNQSELSVASFHTAKSAASEDADYSEREKLLNNDDANDDEDELLNGINSPGLNNDPVKGLGLLSPNVLGRKFQVPEKVTNPETHHEYKSMVMDIEEPLPKPNVKNSEKKHETGQEIQPSFLKREDIDEVKKNRRMSFAGFFKGKKSASSSDLLSSSPMQQQQQQQHQQQKPKISQASKSNSNVPLYQNNHVKSKSFSNFEVLTKKNEPLSESMPRSKSKIFSAFKRRSAYAVPAKDEVPPKQEVKENTKPSELHRKGSLETLKDEKVIKERDLSRRHSKRNSILVPSPVLDNHSFEQPVSKPTLFNDLSFSESMVSSINHNYDIMNQSDGDEEVKYQAENGEEEEDEFNSSFNSINKSFSNEDSPITKTSALLPRDISVGSFRMNFDDFNIDNYIPDEYEQQQQQLHASSIPKLRTNVPTAQRLQHHKTSSKIQNLLGEALFPKSLDINEVASITTLERSRSMKSVRSSNNNSFRESLLFDGMTVVQSPNSPMHEPNSTLLSSPSSILKRRSMEYDDDLQEFANMIDFGDDDDEEDGNNDFTISIDMNLSDYDYVNYEQQEVLNSKSLKPLPNVPSIEYDDYEEDDYVPNVKEESTFIKEEVEGVHFQNPFDYPTVKREEEEEDGDIFGLGVKQEEDDYIKQELETTDEEEEEYEDNNKQDETNYDDDNFSVKIKQEEDFDEDFNDYNYQSMLPSIKSPPSVNSKAFLPTMEEMKDPERPVSMSFRGNGLKGPKFGETNGLIQNGTNTHSLYMSLPESSSQQHLQTSPSRLNLNERILRNYYNSKQEKKVSFSSRIVLFDTYHEEEYDRHPEIATCNQLTPFLAQRIKEELNQIKSDMEVHESSKCYTQFF